jgi:hypothetical protein
MITTSIKSLLKLVAAPVTDPAERRADPRRKVLLKAELFPVLGLADLIINNVSRGGFAAESDIGLQVGQPLLFSIDGKNFHKGTVRWTRGRRAGVNLEDALAIFGLANETDHGSAPGHRPRSARHDVSISAQTAIGRLSYGSTVRDVSRSGLRLETPAPLAERQELLVGLKDRPLMLARVQWVNGGLVGVRTAEKMTTLRLVYTYE